MNAAVLIVDDDTAISGSLQEFMEISGYEAHVADSAEEALSFMENRPVDVVITDILLPEMDGLDLTERVKQNYDAEIIVMTGYSGEYSYEEAIKKGASDLVFKPIRFEELLLRLKRVLKERRLTQERIAMMEKLKKLAITDGLTRLFNSRHFYNQLELEIDRSRRYNHALTLMLMDIDHFKQYNDSFGHLGGDKVLIKLGQLVRSCMRSMDSAYRYGGEEFTVILPETRGEEALAVAKRIGRVIEDYVFYPKPDKAVGITVSIGITEYLSDETTRQFVQRADQAMYISKQQGRNRITAVFGDDQPVTMTI